MPAFMQKHVMRTAQICTLKTE